MIGHIRPAAQARTSVSAFPKTWSQVNFFDSLHDKSPTEKKRAKDGYRGRPSSRPEFDLQPPGQLTATPGEPPLPPPDPWANTHTSGRNFSHTTPTTKPLLKGPAERSLRTYSGPKSRRKMKSEFSVKTLKNSKNGLKVKNYRSRPFPKPNRIVSDR